LTAKTRLNVGITINTSANAQSTLWANGLTQNIVYLALLLQRLPNVRTAGLVCDVKPNAVAESYGFPVWTLAEATEQCDVVIELGLRSFGGEKLERFRKRGGKLVSFVAGNVMAFNLETLAHGRSAGEVVVKHGFDAVWIIPQHWHMCRTYCAITSSPNVHEVPVLWDPVFLHQSAALMRKNPFWREPEDGKFTLGCFDPSINVLKTFHMPLLVSEEAWRTDSSRIDKLLLFSMLKFKESKHVKDMILNTDIGKAGRISLEDRHPLIHVMGSNVHAVVTHQWENNRNYLYYEILYLGWPLIHNVPSLIDAGYHFRDFDPADGGRVLTEALRGHSDIRIKQRDAVREALWAVSVANPDLQDVYAAKLEQVMDQKALV